MNPRFIFVTLKSMWYHLSGTIGTEVRHNKIRCTDGTETKKYYNLWNTYSGGISAFRSCEDLAAKQQLVSKYNCDYN